MSQEPLSPSSQRLRVMEMKNLDVGDQEARVLDCRQDLGKRRYVAAGKNVFGDPRIGDVRTFGPADGMEQQYPVILEQGGTFAEKYIVVSNSDVLKHADGHDPIEPAPRFTIVLQAKLGRAGKPFFCRPHARVRELLPRQSDASDLGVADFGKI